MITVPAGVSLNAAETAALLSALKRLSAHLTGPEILLLRQLHRIAGSSTITGVPDKLVASGSTSQNAQRNDSDASSNARKTSQQPKTAHDLPRGTLTSRQAANALGITPNGVRDLRRRGVLHAELVDRQWQFDATEIRARAKE